MNKKMENNFIYDYWYIRVDILGVGIPTLKFEFQNHPFGLNLGLELGLMSRPLALDLQLQGRNNGNGLYQILQDYK